MQDLISFLAKNILTDDEIVIIINNKQAVNKLKLKAFIEYQKNNWGN